MSTLPNSPPPSLHTLDPAANGPVGPISQAQAALSLEESRVLRSCQSESFWYRSVPLSALLASSAHFGVLRGYLKPHASWGARPKVVLGSIMGYFLGKFTYVDACADKFLVEAPDSNIAEAIRIRRGLPTRRPADEAQPMTSQEPSPFQPVQQPSPIYQNPASPTYGQHGLYQEQQQQTQSSLGGYDELRKRNRETTQSVSAQQQVTGGGYAHPLSVPSQPPPPAVPEYPVSRARVIQPQGSPSNKYGDEGFE